MYVRTELSVISQKIFVFGKCMCYIEGLKDSFKLAQTEYIWFTHTVAEYIVDENDVYKQAHGLHVEFKEAFCCGQ